MAENETVPELLEELREKLNSSHITYGYEMSDVIHTLVDRIERARKRERQEWQRGLLEDILTAEQVRANAGLLVDKWQPDAVYARVRIRQYDLEAQCVWEIEVARIERPAPEWVPKVGYWVKGWNQNPQRYVVGPLKDVIAGDAYPYRVDIGGWTAMVKRVEPLTKEDAE